ncbi:mucin-5AC [Pieris rapae]|uniref:mucin-5AC n=1 Tax=Pieris rapae TaxID=64459 RepID=UPI000B9257BA|nr:mucin-5AC [Pieris rapae]
MSNNLDNDRSITTGKMYPIDLAPQKITIVKNISSADVKMTHIIPSQGKTTGTSQIITHSSAGPIGLMRTATGAQIISSGVVSQGTQIVSQGNQLSQNAQILTQPQLLTSSHILSPCTQIISQGTQLSGQVTNPNNSQSLNTIQTSVTSTVSGNQMLNVGAQLVSGSGNLIVSSSVRTLGGANVRVLPTNQHQNSRPVLTSVNVSSASVLVSKGTSHVPRGLAAGASLAVRPVTASAQATISQGSGWSANSRGRGALVYGSRGLSRGLPPRQPSPAPSPSHTPPHSTQTPLSPHSAIVTLPTTTVLSSSGVISSTMRGSIGVVSGVTRPKTPTPPPPGPRPLPLLQRNYQPAKVVGVANVGVRGVGNSAPPQLYYEVPRAAHPHHARPITPYAHTITTQATGVNTVQTSSEVRQTTTIASTPVLPRPSILRKRDVEGSPSKNQLNTISTISQVGNIGNITSNIANLSNIATLSSISSIGNVVVGNNLSNLNVSAISRVGTLNSLSNLGNIDSVNTMNNSAMSSVNSQYISNTGWEDVTTSQGPGSGSTTMSAASSPTPDEPEPPRQTDVSPRKKPRKQLLTSEVRHCDYPVEEKPPTPPPAPVIPKRPSLTSTYVCGWRSTALHFTRPSDVKRRETRARDIVAIATQKHVLVSAEGWKVHHLTAQMDDLVSLEADVGEQLEGVHRLLETSRAHNALKPLSHSLLELIKGNIQRSKIVCEGIQEAREDILRVFKHRNFVSDILTRQADKRCFRKHRSQS